MRKMIPVFILIMQFFILILQLFVHKKGSLLGLPFLQVED